LLATDVQYEVLGLTNYFAIGEVTSVTDSANFVADLTMNATLTTNNANDYFNYGKLRFRTGHNYSLHMEVKDQTGTGVSNTLKVFLPFPYQIQVGDIFEITVGCDKRLATCKDKFSNHENFQGFPYIPGRDSITRFGGQ
jgi:uncharacterized phage protein (TIGR02218 family)